MYCNCKDGVTTVLNGYLPVPATEYTSEKNTDGTYTVKANSTSKNYTGSKTVVADGKAEDEKPDAPMITKVNVTGNQATVILSGDSEGAAGYDYVISTDRDCITNKDYTSVNKNQVSTSTTFKYVQQEHIMHTAMLGNVMKTVRKYSATGQMHIHSLYLQSHRMLRSSQA